MDLLLVLEAAASSNSASSSSYVFGLFTFLCELLVGRGAESPLVGVVFEVLGWDDLEEEEEEADLPV